MWRDAVGAEDGIARIIEGSEVPVAGDGDVAIVDIGADRVVEFDAGDKLQVRDLAAIGDRLDVERLDKSHQGTRSGRGVVAVEITVERLVIGVGAVDREEVVGQIVAQGVGGAVVVGQRGAIPGGQHIATGVGELSTEQGARRVEPSGGIDDAVEVLCAGGLVGGAPHRERFEAGAARTDNAA